MRQKFELSKIIVKSQPRKDFGNITELADSIRERGLLQPIVLAPDGRLLYGERRYRACQLLGLEFVDVVFDEKDRPEDEIEECQLIENIERQALTWQEEALGLLSVYRKKSRRGALEGWTWGYREASRQFKMAVGTVNYVLLVAKRLEQELPLEPSKRKFWNFSSAADAYRLGILQEQEDELKREAARRAQEAAAKRKVENELAVDSFMQELASAPIVAESDLAVERIKNLRERARDNYLALSKDEALELYLSGPLNPPEEFESYYADKCAKIKEHFTVDLSQTLINGDCIEFMTRPENAGRFDHIITDIPYGIDMDMLNQSNTHGGLRDIESVVNEHDVEENMELMQKFFPATFACTKDHAFVATCCDLMQWDYMYKLATSCGFAVQRWPYIWRKVNQPIMNNCAQYNTTKDYEAVMICRKPRAVLANKRNTSFTDASNTEMVKLTSHPFAKPTELTRDLCDMVSIEGQTILEPFAGRGSMVLAMLHMKRNVVAVEKKPEHFNSLVHNIQEHYYQQLDSRFVVKI